MGNLIFGTTTIQGRTFDDIKVQTSKAGVPRPIVFGTVRPIVGNIIATTAPRIEKVTEEQSGGKGGPSVVENEEVYRTYAIRICEGPVTGIRRVWRNNELVWVSDPEEYAELTYGGSLDEAAIQIVVDIIQGNDETFGAKAEFFLGSYTQMPSAVMQSAFGIDNVHAYRGTCYMVVDDDNLTATGGAIPQYAFEVERCEGFVLTSRPYAVVAVESMQSQIAQVDQAPTVILTEGVDSSFAGITGELNSIFQEYTNYDPEAIDASFVGISGELDDIFQEYTNYEPEAVDASFVGVSGELNQILVAYQNYDPEVVDSVFVSIDGTLT